MKRTLIGIIAVLSSVLIFSACGNIDDESSAEPKVTAADSSSLLDSSETISTKSITTTTVSSADDSSSAVTTTSIVTGTDRNGNVTTLILGEGGKILSTFKNSNTTSKTTTKATAKTTTTKQGNSNNNQNNGGNYNNNGGNNGGNNYQPENNGGNDNNGENNNTPVVNDPPQTQAQTQKKTTTTTQPPQTKPSPVQTEKQFKDLSGLEKIENCGFDDLTKAYLKFGYGKKNVELSDYEWKLIRQDIIDYGMENINGQKDFYIDEWGGYTISYPYPVKLIVNSSYEGEEHAHYDSSADSYYYGFEYWNINDAENKDQLYDISNEVRNRTYEIWNQAIESVHTVSNSSGDFDDPRIAEIACTIEFNIGIMPDGGVWFLTE